MDYQELLREQKQPFQEGELTNRIQIQGKQLTITEDMVKQAIKDLKHKRVPGPSHISGKRIRNGLNKLIVSRNAYITSLYKKETGDNDRIIEDYR